MKGKYISIEGIEGIGKSFFLDKITNAFVIKDTELTEFGEKIIKTLNNDDIFYRTENPIDDVLKFFAIDLEQIEKKVKPNLKKGNVIQDRGADTSCLYAAAQLCKGNKKELMKEYRKLMEIRKKLGLIPEKVIILTGKFEDAVKRAEKRDRKKYTEEEIGMLKLIDYGFKQIAKDKRCFLIDVDKKDALEKINLTK